MMHVNIWPQSWNQNMVKPFFQYCTPLSELHSFYVWMCETFCSWVWSEDTERLCSVLPILNFTSPKVKLQGLEIQFTTGLVTRKKDLVSRELCSLLWTWVCGQTAEHEMWTDLHLLVNQHIAPCQPDKIICGFHMCVLYFILQVIKNTFIQNDMISVSK